MWLKSKYLFLIFSLMALGSCKKEENTIDPYPIVDPYPIAVNQDVEDETLELSLVDTSTVDLLVKASVYASVSGTSFGISIEMLNPFWKLISEEKIHYTCINTDSISGDSHAYSCDSSSNSSLYEVVKLYQESELTDLNTMNTFLGDSIIRVHSYNSSPGGGPYFPSTSYTRSCFTEFDSGYIIFQNDDGERLKLDVRRSFYALVLKEIDRL